MHAPSSPPALAPWRRTLSGRSPIRPERRWPRCGSPSSRPTAPRPPTSTVAMCARDADGHVRRLVRPGRLRAGGPARDARELDVTLDVTLKPTLIELPDLQVTATPLATTSLTSPQPVSVLSGDEIQSHRSAPGARRSAACPGVRSFSTGHGIGKPVIRGLSSTRVLVLADGQRLETQQWGDEHGPQVEAGEADRVSRSSAARPACCTARTRSAGWST